MDAGIKSEVLGHTVLTPKVHVFKTLYKRPFIQGLIFLGFCCTSSSSVLLWTPPSTATRLNFWGGTAHYPCSLREKSPIAKPPSGHLLCSTWLPEGWNLSVGQHVCRQMKKVRSILQSFSEAPMSVLRQLWLSSTGPPPLLASVVLRNANRILKWRVLLHLIARIWIWATSWLCSRTYWLIWASPDPLW